MISASPIRRALFAPDGRVLSAGRFARRPALAHTLVSIVSEGPNAFYTGPIADSIISSIQSTGGVMTLSDLANYAALVYPILSGTYRSEKRVYMSNAPTSGPVLLHKLNLLEHYDLRWERRTEEDLHRFVEIMKCEFAIIPVTWRLA